MDQRESVKNTFPFSALFDEDGGLELPVVEESEKPALMELARGAGGGTKIHTILVCVITADCPPPLAQQRES